MISISNDQFAQYCYWHFSCNNNQELPLSHFQSIRKGIFTEIFFLYIFYTVLRFTKIQNKSNSDEESPQDIDRRFNIFYFNHCICLALPMLYFPGDTVVLFAYLFFIAFLGGVYGEFKENFKLSKAAYTVCYVINILLIIIGMGGLGSYY